MLLRSYSNVIYQNSDETQIFYDERQSSTYQSKFQYQHKTTVLREKSSQSSRLMNPRLLAHENIKQKQHLDDV